MHPVVQMQLYSYASSAHVCIVTESTTQNWPQYGQAELCVHLRQMAGIIGQQVSFAVLQLH